MGAVILFDGVCNLCHASVRFIVEHERDAELRFASLQSDAAEEVLRPLVDDERSRELRLGGSRGRSGEPKGDVGPGSFVLVEDARVYTESTAALRVLRHLRAPWRWARVLLVVPRVVRDPVYRFIGRHRYRWFGRRETCAIPTPELRSRFLD